MIIIEERNSYVNSFYDKLKETHNNLYLCSTHKVVDNEPNYSSSNKVVISYDLNNQIIRNKINKIKRIINKIENLPPNLINHKYYDLYNKENKKKIKLVQLQYKKFNSFLNKFKRKTINIKPNINMKISKLNQRRVFNYKKLI